MKWHIDKTKLFLHDVLVCKKTENIQAYFLNGKLHNFNGPAYRLWYGDGQLSCEIYYLNGQRHNSNGSAHRTWDGNGRLWREEYWVNGEQLTQAQFLARLNK